jgi:hypothetical protein
VADVSAQVDAKVTADGAREGSQWVGFTEHHASGLDGTLSLPDHADNWSGDHLLAHAGEERLVNKVTVVLTKDSFVGLEQLHGEKLVTALFETKRKNTPSDRAYNARNLVTYRLMISPTF